MSDVDVLAPEPVDRVVELSTGNTVIIQPLKARQFFKLLKIVTRGATPLLQNFTLDANEGEEVWVQKFAAVVLLSIPESDQETLEFVASMVKPEGLVEGKNLNKKDRELNEALWDKIEQDLNNPELEDLITIIERIIQLEADDLKALGKRLKSLFDVAKKTGQVK